MTLTRRTFLKIAALGAAGLATLRPRAADAANTAPAAPAQRRPNVLFIFTDDMGAGDLGCTGGTEVKTPALDRLAAEGLRFTQFYVASPICSPSRVGVTTGMAPARWRINDYLHERQANRDHGQADWLDPKAPTLARVFKEAGYATAHIGKWHLGGGRDVTDAPLPTAYGFDESLVSSHPLEGMGPALDPKMPRHATTAALVDRTIDFVRRAGGRPFFVALWPMDVHTPHVPDPAALPRYADAPAARRRFDAVLDTYDRHLGRLLDFLRDAGLEENTIVLFSSDNGPEPSFEHRRTGGLRGMKWSLYEGGIRTPFIIRWKGMIPAGRVNADTVLAAVDLLPSLAAMTGAALPAGFEGDGEDLSAALLGKPAERKSPLFWEYGRANDYLKPRETGDRSPNVAMREGRWKLLVNADGSGAELYNLAADPRETVNLAAQQPDVTRHLTDRALRWRRSLP